MQRPKNFPPGPQWYPFVGNSVQLRKTARKLGGTPQVYEMWSKEFNSPDVVGFSLGNKLFIVGLSYKAVFDIHNKQAFEGRPRNLFTKLRTFNTHAGIMIADGDLWREHRSFAMKRLKSLGFGCAAMQEMIENELVKFKEVVDREMAVEGCLWPGKFLATFVMNVLWKLVAGNEEIDGHSIMSKELFRLLDERSKAFDFSGGLLSDFPWLRFILPEYSGFNLMCRFNEEIKSILQKIIDHHKRTYTPEKANDDFVYTFIHEMKMQEGNPESTFTEIQLMIVMVDFFIGGAHTPKEHFDLALMTLALYEDIQEELHREVEKVSTTNLNFLNISEHRDMPFLEAYLMEIGRFYSIVPISGPRRVLYDTELCGFRIPKGTTALIGLEAVHMDKTFWEDPEVFRPSRFLNSSRSEIINSDRVLQFGQGRRSCLGIALGKTFLHTFLAGIVKDYKISVAPGQDPPNQNLLPGIFKSVRPYKV
uniref:Cytochrome n=1 Tax=Lutzomyia longipalpis TaxID=7200 RepID=A0A1B0C9Q5_LUTLO